MPHSRLRIAAARWPSYRRESSPRFMQSVAFKYRNGEAAGDRLKIMVKRRHAWRSLRRQLLNIQVLGVFHFDLL